MKDSAIPDILAFWFEEITPKQWFTKDPEFDALLEDRFGKLVNDALGARLDSWAQTSDGCLALILLLDQMTRNIHRDTPLAFAGDEMALAHALRGVDKGYLVPEVSAKNTFLLMPLMHSEDIEIHKLAVPLFASHTNEMNQDYLQRHTDIIERFGHYPHRNAILGRPSTEEETQFLTQPGSRF